MEEKETVALDNKTIAKLAMAIALAIDLNKNGEVVGPTANKILLYLDQIEGLPHFFDYQN